MILVTHAVVGAAVVSLIPDKPILGIILAFGSHYLMDAIPHWHYRLRSLSLNPEAGKHFHLDRDTIHDLFAVCIDGISGLAFSFIIFSLGAHISPLLVLLGAGAAMFPDFLQFVYAKVYTKEPLIFLQKFHYLVHTKKHLNDMKIVGPGVQALLILILAFLAVL